MSQVWLITGASRGLGRALTEAALAGGHRVLATARNPGHLVGIANKFEQRVRTVSLDVTDEDQAQNAVESAVQAFGRVDVLVNNAGFGNVSPVEDTPLAEFRTQIETNLFGTIIMTKAVLPYFRVQRSGHIIQISSIGGRVGPIGRAPYTAAKSISRAFQSNSLTAETTRDKSNNRRTRWIVNGFCGILNRASGRASRLLMDCRGYCTVSARLRWQSTW